MADLQVVYDADIECGTIVDLDTNRPFGPIMVGPAAKDTLQAFIDGMPFDITILDSEQCAQVFEGWFQNILAPVLAETATDTQNPLEQSGSPSADGIALAEREAAASAGEPPALQSADTDQQSNPDTSSTTVVDPPTPALVQPPSGDVPTQTQTGEVINCGLCNPQGQGSTDPACIACGGSGKLARVQ